MVAVTKIEMWRPFHSIKSGHVSKKANLIFDSVRETCHHSHSTKRCKDAWTTTGFSLKLATSHWPQPTAESRVRPPTHTVVSGASKKFIFSRKHFESSIYFQVTLLLPTKRQQQCSRRFYSTSGNRPGSLSLCFLLLPQRCSLCGHITPSGGRGWGEGAKGIHIS